MAAMAATAMVGGCGAKDAAPTGAETKPAETSAAQETEAAQEETKEADAHEAEYLAEFFDVQIKEDPDSAAFSADLKKVAGDEAPAVEGDMTWFSAVKAAVAAADYEELVPSSEYKIGFKNVKINSIEIYDDNNILIKGENFNKYSKIYINNQYTKTTFIDQNTIMANNTTVENESSIVVTQRTSGGGKLSSTNIFTYPIDDGEVIQFQ